MTATLTPTVFCIWPLVLEIHIPILQVTFRRRAYPCPNKETVTIPDNQQESNYVQHQSYRCGIKYNFHPTLYRSTLRLPIRKDRARHNNLRLYHIQK